MAHLGISAAWYYLVFTTIALAFVTFAAIMSHVPRIPQQRGLLAVVIVSAFAAVIAMLLTQLSNPANDIEVSALYTELFKGSMIAVMLVALLDFFYYWQGKRRGIDGAGWSLTIGIALLLCALLGLYTQYG